MTLSVYRKKRKFSQTPEPSTAKHTKGKTLRFVVQEHHASHLHWDFRLELDGVLKSWAVPKGPSMDPNIKHLAVQVEDHPYAYRTFHGVIPKGNYGAGTVKIWDEGTYTPVEQGNDPQKILRAGLKKGDVKFILHGKKLKGAFVLVQLKKNPKDWLLIKEKDSVVSNIEKTVPAHGKRAKMPHDISPMLAKTAESPFNDPEWVFEIKWDGYRAIGEIEDGEVKLYSRNQQDFTQRYQPVVHDLESIAANTVLDGEVVAVDEKGTPKFQLLQDYTKSHRGTLIYYIFDILYLDGKDLRGTPLLERKKLLKELIPEKDHIRYSDHIEKYGLQLFDMVKSKHIEGIMAKKTDSSYVSSRSSQWLKIKNINMQEAIICGFTEPNGNRKAFGALVLGMYDNGELRYVGHTGSGFDEKKLHEIIAILKPLITKTCPFPFFPQTNTPATWVKPKKVCQVKFTEWTNEGMMRHPIFLGLREDKKPEEVTQEHLVIARPRNGEAISSTHSKVQFSNLDKVYWPKEGYTKGDVISYYDQVSRYILPYLKDRPESLNRHPNGIEGESFFQKDILTAPKWVKTIPLHSDSEKKKIHWLLCNDKDTLLYMANLGCIEINPWSSRISKQDNPDYLIIDLDPNGSPFSEVITTALTVKKIMDKAEIDCFIKTSGKTGLHILVPLGAKYTFDQTRQFAELIAHIASSALPQTTSIIRDPRKRKKKVYIDFLQNRIGQTIAAPYSLRPVPGAQVSTPLHWNEVADIEPADFTIKNILKRLEKKGDIWKGFLSHKGITMKRSLTLLEKL